MVKVKKKGKIIILVPYPAQGHVNPMMKLALAFLSLGFDPVMITPEFIHRRIVTNIDPNAKVKLVSVPDELEKDEAPDFFAIEKALEDSIPYHLESVVRKIDEDGEVLCMLVDLLASSAIEVGRRCGVPVAGYWPAMLPTYQIIRSIPDLLSARLISQTGSPRHGGQLSCVPNSPALSTRDLPWLIGNQAARRARFKFWRRTMDRARDLNWLLMNSFSCGQDDEHSKVFQVGALNSSKQGVTKCPSLWEEDKSCLQWLDEQKPNSVLYISFGSWVSPIEEAKVASLASTLEEIGQPFIWVLGHAWRQGLPKRYPERVSKQGKVVSWAPQMEILKHEAVGCYLTHCGWNSIMEAIQCRKRLLCYPVAGDQFVNCAYVVQKWRIGIRIYGFGYKDVEESLRRVMDDTGMNCRLMRLYESTMGDDARFRAMANLTTFLHNITITTCLV
ncbi:UDP-glycosyltransferase 82A1 [Mercurialis annua]|uniref:UDP-glycosyltransferase 82A1 n=1 Tax=Mercurialis annua TaxID=3986 RepID=UPI00215DEEBF|nr:UDP-glycosyltransferase 82A1 [Mercurialis annua]